MIFMNFPMPFPTFRMKVKRPAPRGTGTGNPVFFHFCPPLFGAILLGANPGLKSAGLPSCADPSFDSA
jgi:hypothetical protein